MRVESALLSHAVAKRQAFEAIAWAKASDQERATFKAEIEDCQR
jgi:hypothetical protein